jgi:hypothetical protein
MAFLKWLLLLLSLSLAHAQTPEQELIVKVLKLLTYKGKSMVVYEHQPAVSLQGSSFESLTQECHQAGLVYGMAFESLPSACKSLPRFSTDYEIFQKDKNSIGAFYWRKGRPQLRFNKERCEDFNIILPQELVQYAQ